MKSFLELARNVAAKAVTFMESEVKIRKLTVAEIRAIQDAANKKATTVDADGKQVENLDTMAIEMVWETLKRGVVSPAFGEATIQDLEQFPLDELHKLMTEILSHSGLGEAVKGN